MSAASVDVIRWGRERARTARGGATTKWPLSTRCPNAPLPSAEFLRRCLETLAARGYRRVVTGALSPLEQAGFLAAGFDVEERLHLLGIDLLAAGSRGPAGLSPAPGPAPVATVRSWPWTRPRFPPSGSSTRRVWPTPCMPRRRCASAARWDRGGHRWLRHLRPVGRTRGLCNGWRWTPATSVPGTGRRLLLDGLTWMRRRGVARAVVNTQVGNAAALALYLQIGFEEEPIGLSVLSAGLP